MKSQQAHSIHPIFSPKNQHIVEEKKHQDDTLYSLLQIVQILLQVRRNERTEYKGKKQISLWKLKHNKPLGAR